MMLRTFTLAEVGQIVQRYLNGEPSGSIAKSFGCSMTKVLNCLRNQGIQIRKKEDQAPYIPTPEDIIERSAQVRAGWTKQIEKDRRVISETNPVSVAICNMAAFKQNGIPTI